jgi:hypothetical protein
MKYISVFLFIFLISFNCFSQSLEGEWKGSFTSSMQPGSVYGISVQNNCWPTGGYVNLKFILNNDSSYTVYSFYKGSDTINVCEVLYKRISKNSIYLEEKKIIKPEYNQGSRAFQKMKLEIKQRKKSMALIGSFNFVSGGLCGNNAWLNIGNYGEISFYKKTEKKSRE